MCIFNIFLNKDLNEPNSTITQILYNSLLYHGNFLKDEVVNIKQCS